MGKGRRRRFTREFKLEAVRLLNESGKTAAVIASDLGINGEVLRRWRQQLSEASSPKDAFPGNGKLTSVDEELRLLRRENAILREERAILKKATAFFARESR
ncbi:MAG: transposase [Gemmatimonadaceae bacterium]